MGHLRYSTTGKKGLQYVHPLLRRNNWRARNLCLCGNFNMTNAERIFNEIVSFGQHPRNYSDTYVLLEQIGHRLDRESERLFREAVLLGKEKIEITHYIEDHIDMSNVLRSSCQLWDGGYVICGITGSGEMFALRDPWGIRPAFWYKNDEQVVVASERPVIQTTLFVESSEVNELMPGQALIVNKKGEPILVQIMQPRKFGSDSFERIYFSRGNDADIYRERKALGRQFVKPILNAVGGDLLHTVISFIPNTAEAAFYGMAEGLNEYLNCHKKNEILDLGNRITPEQLDRILNQRVRMEKVAWKDIKMRTFIAEGTSRNDLASHVYDITYGSIVPYKDNLVIIDDSIVRGTTLKESILRILDRLHPKKIVVISSSPQVRFPDYYGIDMPSLEEFIAFRATMELLKDRCMMDLIYQVADLCRTQSDDDSEEVENYVKRIYAPFSAEEISAKMADMLRSEDVDADIEIVYQSLAGLHAACPGHPGDWYFSGDYPTPGGVHRVNRAFVEFVDKTFGKRA